MYVFYMRTLEMFMYTINVCVRTSSEGGSQWAMSRPARKDVKNVK